MWQLIKYSLLIVT